MLKTIHTLTLINDIDQLILIINDNDPNFRVDDHVRISKDKNIFAKGYTPN